MRIKKIDEFFTVSTIVDIERLASLVARGYHTLICAVADEEDEGQVSFEEIAKEARMFGLAAIYMPIGPCGPSPEDVDRFAQIMAKAEGMVIAYGCNGDDLIWLYDAYRVRPVLATPADTGDSETDDSEAATQGWGD